MQCLKIVTKYTPSPCTHAAHLLAAAVLDVLSVSPGDVIQCGKCCYQVAPKRNAGSSSNHCISLSIADLSQPPPDGELVMLNSGSLSLCAAESSSAQTLGTSSAVERPGTEGRVAEPHLVSSRWCSPLLRHLQRPGLVWQSGLPGLSRAHTYHSQEVQGSQTRIPGDCDSDGAFHHLHISWSY